MPVTYPLVPLPQWNMNDLMSMVQTGQRWEEQSRESRTAKRINEAFTQAKGDPLGAADHLDTLGEGDAARTLREKAHEARRENLAGMQQRITQFSDVGSRGAQILREATPETWTDVRPRIVELFGSVDAFAGQQGMRASLSSQVPEQYDERALREMMDRATRSHAQLQRTREILTYTLAEEKKSQDQQARTQAHAKSLGDLLETLTDGSPEQRDAFLSESGAFFEPAAIQLMKGWAKKPTKPTTIQAALLDPNLTPERREELLNLERDRTAESGGEPFERWAREQQRDLGRKWTRAEYLRERTAFLATGREPREADGDLTAKRQAETWLANQLRDLDALRRPQVDRVTRETIPPVITSEADAQREEDRIYDLYQGMTGQEHRTRPVRRRAPDQGVRIRRADGSWAVPEGWPGSGAPADQGVPRPSAPRTATSQIGPSSATADPSARPAVTAPSRPTTQSAIPTARDFRIVDNMDGSVTVTAPDGSTVPFRNRREAQSQIEQYLQQIAQP